MSEWPLFMAARPILPETQGLGKSTSIVLPDLLLIFGVGLVLLLVLLYWAAYVRKPKKHRKHHHHNEERRVHRDTSDSDSGHRRYKYRYRRREHRGRNPSLAETGGLPSPAHAPKEPPPS